MKNAVFGLLSLVAVSSVHAAPSKEFLTDVQKKTVLSETDSTCADTWCEGDYNYSFDAIACDSVKKSCVLSFQMIENNDFKPKMAAVGWSKSYTARIFTSHSVSCEIKNLSQYSDLISDGDLNWDRYYVPLNDCIAVIEKKLRNP